MIERAELAMQLCPLSGVKLHAFVRNLFSVFPIIRVPVELHYGEDKYSTGFNAVEHTIRKSAGKTTADITFQRRSCFGIGKNVLNR